MRGFLAKVAAFTVLIILLLIAAGRGEAQESLLPIGAIQGDSDVSPYLNRFVNFRGIVVGRYEDVNTRGIVYHTLFVQDINGITDGDSATSDAIAVFLGRDPRLDIPLGAQVRVGGKVTEFYGLTEIDDDGLVIVIENPDGVIPSPVIIEPPADIFAQADYFEAFEGMRVAFANGVVVAGATHSGCGFAVIDAAHAAELPIIRRADDDPTGYVMPVLYPSDLDCEDIPQVKVGDRIERVEGVLTYNFDQFKIIVGLAGGLELDLAAMSTLPPLPPLGPLQATVATINLKDYFDVVRDTNLEGEPVLTDAELQDRQVKLLYVVARLLDCPTVLALQEVEHRALLTDLADSLRNECGFTYQVSHLETPDSRGIDNALLSDPRRVTVGEVSLRQTCSPVPTTIVDPAITCESGWKPLFGRPPLQVQAWLDGEPIIFLVNHFKSKRGGEIETDLQRVRQAIFLNGLAAEMLAVDPDARIIALGDFNDIELSPILALLSDPAQGGRFTSALSGIDLKERYTYNFGGVAELLDYILLSPALAQEVGWATIIHSNTDYPVGWRFDTSPERLAFQLSDHDIPVIALGRNPEPTVAPSPQPSIVRSMTPIAEPTLRPVATPRAVALPATVSPIVESEIEPVITTSRAALGWLPLVIGGILILFIVAVLIHQWRRKNRK